MSRARLITAAAFAGNLGWGAVLPYQYAYVVDARHWGPTAGVLTGTLFCIGAVVAAPLAGRLSDRLPAARLAVAFELLGALACLGMGLAGDATLFLAAMLVFGAALTAASPATQVMILEAVPAVSRRAVFAYQFTAMALGMAVGSFIAGLVIDLSHPTGMWPAFVAATLGFAGSAALLGAAGRGGAPALAEGAVSAVVPAAAGAGATGAFGAAGGADAAYDAGVRLDAAVESSTRPSGRAAYRTLLADRRVRLLAIVSMLLSAGFYAQFETGLPAFALQSLHVRPSTVGTAAAVNCLVIVALQWIVTKVTGRNPGAVLLAVVGSIWVMSWLLLEGSLFTGRATAGTVFVLAFGLFAVGETMFAPILSPLTAAIAPAGLVGTALGAMAALRTGVSAAGPLIAGLLITAGLPHVFVLMHVAINLAAIAVALRLARGGRGTRRQRRAAEASEPTSAPAPAELGVDVGPALAA